MIDIRFCVTHQLMRELGCSKCLEEWCDKRSAERIAELEAELKDWKDACARLVISDQPLTNADIRRGQEIARKYGLHKKAEGQ